MRLDGVRILDLTRLLPGPYATQLLADAGADVVKIEDTGAGDYARETPPLSDDGVGRLFDAVNRGKRSVAIDLKARAGRDAFYRLAATADVVFEQFRPGVAERLGVDYETVRGHNPEVVYCSLSGYGQEGPWADRVGHDLNYVALAGLLDMTRESPDAPPVAPGYQIADMGGGLFAAFAIVGALLSRELGNTGGEYVDVSMTDVVLSFSQSVACEVFAGEDPRPGESALTGGYPWYDVYETADGRYVTLAALEPKFWEAFCEATGRTDLLGHHMTDDPATLEALRGELEELFAERTQAEWEAELGDEEAMFCPVRTPAEAVEHPQVDARGIVDRSREPPRVGAPARASEEPPDEPGPPPRHGEHTDEVLGEVLDADELEALRDAGAVR